MRRMKKITITILIVTMMCIIFPCTANATCPSGIMGNGTNGISININSAPYTTFATYPYGQNAYTNAGCAWFASARVKQLTGKGTTIWAGWAWYNTQYGNYGFSRGSVPRAKSLACYENHVAVVEAVNGDTITVSQGGDSVNSDAAHGYCSITTKSRYDLEHSSGSGAFYGYVYLDGASGNYVDIGTNFYAAIINNNTDINSWKHIGVNGTNVELQNQGNNSKQHWYFERQSDLSYKITNTYNGLVLDDAYAGHSGSNVWVYPSNNGTAQRWFITGESGNYHLHPACAKECSLDINGGSGEYGANVQVWTTHGGGAQKFAIWKLTDSDLAGTKLTLAHNSNGTVKFNWNTRPYADYYHVRIFKDKLYSGVDYSKWNLKSNSATVTLPAGHYFAYIDSCNKVYYKGSNIVEFNVTVNQSEPTKKTQAIYAKNYVKKYGDKGFYVDAKASGGGKLSFSSNNPKVATVSSSGKVTIKGIGTASITVTAAETSYYKKAAKIITVTVNPKSVSISRLSNSKRKKMVIKWKRNSTVTGYQIAVATDRSFKNAVTYKISRNKTLSKTISVKKGKTYYVKIRTYKGSLVSNWSSVKKRKITR